MQDDIELTSNGKRNRRGFQKSSWDCQGALFLEKGTDSRGLSMIFEQMASDGDRNFGYLIGEEKTRKGIIVNP